MACADQLLHFVAQRQECKFAEVFGIHLAQFCQRRVIPDRQAPRLNDSKSEEVESVADPRGAKLQVAEQVVVPHLAPVLVHFRAGA
jgi:hypothetical protein